jgi:glycosyltransferase involved in cell wall biosynthesis
MSSAVSIPYGILHLARTPFTGVWSVMRNLALYQAQAGYPVAVGVLTYPRWTGQYGQALAELEQAGIATFTAPIPDLPYTALFPYLVARWRITGHPWNRWLAEFCRERNLSRCIVHCHNAWLSGAYVPYRGEQTLDVRFVATYHGIQGAPELRRSRGRRIIHRWLARRFVRHGGLLASVDAENTHVAEELFRIPATAFRVIPNGVPEVRALGPAPFPTDAPVIGHVGTLNEGKGWRITAEAVQLANQRGVRCRFVAAGNGPEADKTEAWCATHSSIATFLGQVENAGEVVTPHLTLFALPSRSEGSPMAAIEALAAGVPVLGTAVSGLAHIIDHGCSGLTVERNAQSLADAIYEALTNPELLKTLRQGAYEVFCKRFHIAHCATAYDAFYRNAMNNERA